MRILVNRLTALRQKAGMGHYIAELARCLPATAGPDDRVHFYPGPLVEHGLRCWQNLRGRSKKAAPKRASTGGAGWRAGLGRRLANWHFRCCSVGGGFDLYHEPNYLPAPCAKATIATIADLSLLLYPEWHPAERARHFAKHFAEAVARCAHIITISEFSRQEIVKHLGVAPERVTCTYMGIRRGLGPLPVEQVRPVLARLGLPEQYCLFVGTLEPRKNVGMLMDAYAALGPDIRSRCPLVLAGGWGWNASALLEKFERQARPKGAIHLGYVAEADLPALYNGARALVFPTHYEGFGLPPLEMMACGGAVLASRAGAVVETAGPCAHLLDAGDTEAWSAALARLVREDDWRQQLRMGAEALAARFTWERCARETWHVYRHVLHHAA